MANESPRVGSDAKTQIIKSVHRDGADCSSVLRPVLKRQTQASAKVGRRRLAWLRTCGFCAGLTSKRVTDPRDYAVPLSLFRGGIINEHAVHGTARPIAAIVPDAVLADAGHDEEIRCDPLVDDAWRRVFLGQERGGCIVVGIGHVLHREIGPLIVGEEAPPCSAFRRSGIPREDCDGHLDAGSGARDRVSPPFRICRMRKRRNEDQGEGARQTVRAHRTISGSSQSNQSGWSTFVPTARHILAEPDAFRLRCSGGALLFLWVDVGPSGQRRCRDGGANNPRSIGKPNRHKWRAIRRAAEKVAVRISPTHMRPGGVIWRAKTIDAEWLAHCWHGLARGTPWQWDRRRASDEEELPTVPADRAKLGTRGRPDQTPIVRAPARLRSVCHCASGQPTSGPQAKRRLRRAAALAGGT